MLEKQGKVVLTDEDIHLYNRGEVSTRVKQTWDLSFSDLKDVIDSHSYTIIKVKDVE